MIVLTRDPDGNRRWAAELEQAGFTVFQAPMIQTEPLPLTEAGRRTLQRIREFDWLILTSSRALPALHALLHAANVPPGLTTPVAAVGERTAEAARAAGWNVKFIPLAANSVALAEGLKSAKGANILMARTSIGASTLAMALRARGAQVTDLPVYSTTPVITPRPQLEKHLADGMVAAIVLASPSAVTGFTQSLTATALTQAQELPVTAVGPTTAAAATAAGFRNVRTAPSPTVGGLIDAINR